MILAGSRPGDIILDCFGGSGTTAMVATELGRNAISIDLSPEYVEMQKRRTAVTPGLALA
jgi:DNA modification methylase